MGRVFSMFSCSCCLLLLLLLLYFIINPVSTGYGSSSQKSNATALPMIVTRKGYLFSVVMQEVATCFSVCHVMKQNEAQSFQILHLLVALGAFPSLIYNGPRMGFFTSMPTHPDHSGSDSTRGETHSPVSLVDQEAKRCTKPSSKQRFKTGMQHLTRVRTGFKMEAQHQTLVKTGCIKKPGHPDVRGTHARQHLSRDSLASSVCNKQGVWDNSVTLSPQLIHLQIAQLPSLSVAALIMKVMVNIYVLSTLINQNDSWSTWKKAVNQS